MKSRLVSFFKQANFLTTIAFSKTVWD